MKKKIKNIIAMVCMVVVALCICADFSFAAKNCDVCDGYNEADKDLICKGCGDNHEDDLQKKIKNILNTVFVFVGIIAVVMIIIGGVKYMTSMGDPGKVQSAKNTILYSVIGLIVAVSAFAIVNFVLGAIK